MFGEGVHPKFEKLLREELAPFLSQGAANFWTRKSRYFKNGLYYHGGMGRLIRAVRALARITRQVSNTTTTNHYFLLVKQSSWVSLGLI
jgi:betaine lipid synthase